MASRRAAVRAKDAPKPKAVVSRAKPVARPRAVPPPRVTVEAAIETLRAEVADLTRAVAGQAQAIETLVSVHEGLSESMMRLPRAEDYEPLTGPLLEFARVAPVLADTLGAVVKAIAPLPALMERVHGAIDAAPARSAVPLPSAVPAPGDLRAVLAEAADRMAAARIAIREGLSSLPRDRAYGEAASRLRELATVSPSLMEWLRHLPTLSLPLGSAIGSLEEAAQDLAEAEREARAALAHTDLE